MKTGFERVIASPPTGRQSSRGLVHLKNLDLTATLSRVDSSAKTGDTAADYDNFPRIFRHAQLTGTRHATLN
jgi:hypothetical protein